MNALKLTVSQVGGSLAVVLPPEVLARLKVGEGDALLVTEAPNGVTLTPYDPETQRQVQLAGEFMRKYDEAFRALAASEASERTSPGG